MKNGYFVKSLVALSLVGTLAMANNDLKINDDNRKNTKIKSSIQLKDKTSEMDEKMAAKIDVEKVTEIVKSQINGTVTDVQLENINNNLVYTVEVLDRNQMTNIIVDAGNGKILASKIDKKDFKDDEDEDDENNNDENESWYEFWK